MTPDTLVVTVDVECDSDGGPTWRYSRPAAFRGVSDGVAETLVPLLEETNACATLLISNVVLEHEPSIGILRELPRVELGAHLHGDFIEPHRRFADPAGAKTIENQCEYVEEVERAKLVKLGILFEEAFGHQPRAFRAGRWSASGRTARLLAELGYTVDSSVTPHVHWKDGGRSVDFREAPEQPYKPDGVDISRPGDVPIWEFPVSIAARWWTGGRPVWLRPSLSHVTLMKSVVRSIAARYATPRTHVAMLHNTELTPGTSPYSRTPDEAARVRRRLRALLHWAAAREMRFSTLTEAAAHCAS